jgi:hypothetical protein
MWTATITTQRPQLLQKSRSEPGNYQIKLGGCSGGETSSLTSEAGYKFCCLNVLSFEFEHSLRNYLTKYTEEECRWESNSYLASQ